MAGRGVIPITSERRPSMPIIKTFCFVKSVWQAVSDAVVEVPPVMVGKPAFWNVVRRSKVNDSRLESSGVEHMGKPCVGFFNEAV